MWECDKNGWEKIKVAWMDLGLVALLSSIVFTYAHLQAFTNHYVIQTDVRQQIYWMQSWQDPTLFKGDLLSDYARHYVPWGVKGLYWLASWAISPITFSKILPGLLFVLLACCLYKIAETMTGQSRPAWLTVAIFWIMPFFLYSMSGGMARAFATPLLALFLLCWLNHRPLGVGIALMLLALFIPYIFPVAGGAALLSWGVARIGKGTTPPFPARWTHFIWLFLAASIVFFFNKGLTTAGYGPLVSLADMTNHPEFTGAGPYGILPLRSFTTELTTPFFKFIPSGWRKIGYPACAVLLGFAAYNARSLPWETLKLKFLPIVYLSLASLFFYCLARLFLLKLFIPNRYLIYSLNLFYCLGFGLLVSIALRVNRWPLGVLILTLILAAGLGGLRLKLIALTDCSSYRPLYVALAQTPKDAIIAGHPYLMDNVPTFAQRQAFVTNQLAHVWSKGYWQRVRPRVDDLFAAYYAADPEQVIAFCRKYHISFLVVDDRHFAPAFLAGGRFYIPFDNFDPEQPISRLLESVRCPFFAPFDEQIRRQVGGRREFALISARAFISFKVDEHIKVLDMRPYLQ